MLKRGDTLIEVTLAVGIFSLVAIAVVAVVNGSTTGAQTALETTLTRDEIDAQADALRFIQSSYAGSLNPSAENIYSDEITGSAFATIWDAIVSNAHPSNTVDLDELLFNNPARKDNPCSALYEPEANGLDAQKAFVINTKKLSDINLGDDDIAKNIVIKATTDSLKTKTFAEAQTYPHVIYKDPDEEETTDPESLVSSDGGSILDRAEGVYIVAVKDTNTVIVSGDGQIDNGSGDANTAIPAYYDFYIRSCWYPTGSETPTTISTVMRLDNPVLLADAIVPEDDLTVPIYIRTSPGIDRVILNGTECTTQTVCRVNNLVRGQSYPLTAVLKEYYEFETYKNSNNQGRIANPLKIETSYTVGNRSTIITPYAKSKSYDIYIIPETGVASVTLAGTSCTNKSGCVVKDLQQGTRYPLTATLEAHYDFVEWINTENRGAVANDKAAITNYTVGNGPTILRATAKLQTFDCNKRYRLQNADGSYPSSYTNDGSTKVEYGSTCTYSKSMDGYVSQSKSVTITGATTISLDLPRTTYTLTVNRNASYIQSVTGAGTYRWGVNVPITATPKSDGLFTNWTQTAGTTSSFANANSASTTFTMPKSNATVYANGKEKVNCPAQKICYLPNGADGGLNTMSNQSANSNSSVTLIAPNYSRSGYGFVSWNTKSDGSGTDYGPNQTITTGNLNSSGLVLYARWVASAGNMQGWTGCSSLSAGNVTALTDTRDNMVYAVAKLADGKCWMIENLRLNPKTASITKANTNNPTNAFLSEMKNYSSSNTWSDECYGGNGRYYSNDRAERCRQDYAYNTNNINRSLPAKYINAASNDASWYSYGVMYNYHVASAGNLLNIDFYDDIEGNWLEQDYWKQHKGIETYNGDICPKGWKMPSANVVYSDTYNLNRVINGGATDKSDGLRKYPNNFIYSGVYTSDSSGYYDSTPNRGTYGSYWGDGTHENNTAYQRMNANADSPDFTESSSLFTGWSSSIGVGQAIRCVYDYGRYKVILKPNGNEGEIVLSTHPYVANGHTEAQDITQTITRNVSTKLEAQPFKRHYYKFIGWATSPGGKVVYADQASVYNIAEKGQTITLYAKWEKLPTYKVVYETNGGEAIYDKQTNKTAKTYTRTYERGRTYRMAFDFYYPENWDIETYTPRFERPGYAFDGWITGTGCSKSGVKYLGMYVPSIKDLASENGTCHMKAIWSKIDYYM